jgi:DNA-binding MurR/RpiR family transcriptional regulator
LKGTRVAKTDGQLSRLYTRFAKAEEEGRLNATRRALIRAILEDSTETYFLSSRELARRYGMDTATIVRTIQALGYKRFADFAADLREHFVMGITPYRVMKTATETARAPADHVAASLEKDIANIVELRSQLDLNRVVQAARQILRARRVLIVGIDFAASLAWGLDYHLTVFGIHSEAPTGTSGSLQHKVRTLTSKDLLIAISFGRCLRETVNAVNEARSRGVATLGITDSEFSPIARHCDVYLLASIANPSLAASYAAAMALLNCILIACAHIAPKRALQVLQQREKDHHESERWYEEGPRLNKPG